MEGLIWRRHDLDPQTVHLRRENDDLHEQNQRFSGRTSMRPDALDSGDFSLNLMKIHLSDTGSYTCSIDDGREEFMLSEVKLWINGT
uniref:Ig-like domain-containing protein n=1 Tax=Cyprinodon variegatus TaxID=28743 RepID=A0A3Q2DFE8_CYPVA